MDETGEGPHMANLTASDGGSQPAAAPDQSDANSPESPLNAPDGDGPVSARPTADDAPSIDGSTPRARAPRQRRAAIIAPSGAAPLRSTRDLDAGAGRGATGSAEGADLQTVAAETQLPPAMDPRVDGPRGRPKSRLLEGQAEATKPADAVTRLPAVDVSRVKRANHALLETTDALMDPELAAADLARVTRLVAEHTQALLSAGRPLKAPADRFSELDGLWHRLEHHVHRALSQGAVALEQSVQLEEVARAEAALDGAIKANICYKQELERRLAALRQQQEALEAGQVFARRQVANMNAANAAGPRRDAELAVKSVNYNGAWRERKIQKYRQQTQLGKMLHKISYLEKQLHDDRAVWQDRLNRGTQEIARLNTQITSSRAKLRELDEAIASERAACDAIAQRASSETARFGPFAQQTTLTPGLDTLRLDIEPIHELNAETRRFALMHLSDRFDQLRALSQHLRRVVDRSKAFHDTLDLSDTLDTVNLVCAELCDSSQARVLLLDDHATFLYCIQPATTGEEEGETQLRFDGGAGITAASIRGRLGIVAVENPVQDPRFDESVDAVLGVPPHHLMACPLLMPGQPERAVGVIQCMNKKSMGARFDDVDKLTLTLLASQAASAIINAKRYDGQVRKEFYSARLLELCESFPTQRELKDLSHLVTSKARDLFNADRAAVFFVVGHDASGPLLSPEPRGIEPRGATWQHARDAAPADADELVRHVARTGVARNVVDVSAEPLYGPAFDDATGFHALRMLCAPLKAVAGDVVAVLCIVKGWPKAEPPAKVWKDPRLEPFSGEEEQVLSDYCQLAAVVVQNAYLWSRLQQQPRLIPHLTSSLTMRECLALATSNVQELCPCEGVRFLFSDEDTQGIWAFDVGNGVQRLHRTPLLQQVLEGGVSVSVAGSRQVASTPRPLRQDAAQPGDRVPGITTRQMLMLPIHVPESLATSEEPAGAWGVMQLVNRVDGLPFDHADEYVLAAFGRKLSYAFWTAQANDKAASEEQANDVLARAIIDIHDFADISGRDEMRASLSPWIVSNVSLLIAADVVQVFWMRGERFCTELRADASDILAPNMQPKVAAQKGVGASATLELFVGILTSENGALGIIRVAGSTARQGLLGVGEYSRSEVAAVGAFGRHVGAFLESCNV